MPSSSPSTIPVRTARRSPVVPRASVCSTCACSRSATPPIPPRRPTRRASSPRSTTWMPCRASHARSSKPVSGPRGATGCARSSRIAPCGGARSRGSSSRTRSLSSSSPKRSTCAGKRSANGVRRTGPVTTTRASARSPIRSARKLRSSALSRSVPQQSPTSASATAARATRRRSRWTIAASPAPAATGRRTACDGRNQMDDVRPRHAAAARSAGQFVVTRRLTA